MREVGTDNSINFNYKTRFTGEPWVDVLRYTPESSFQSPDVIASFNLPKFSYIHSFSITENYAVFLFYPVKIDPEVMNTIVRKKFFSMNSTFRGF